jgi:hypothetical protein
MVSIRYEIASKLSGCVIPNMATQKCVPLALKFDFIADRYQ